MSRVFWSVAVWSIAALLPLCGCKDPYAMAPVSGKLSLDGKPVAGVNVVFIPMNIPESTGRPAFQPGRPARGTSSADGSFTLEQDDGQSGAVVGPHQVMFEPPLTKRRTIPGSERELMSPEDIKAMEAQIVAMNIYPPLPMGLKISPNEVEVQPGQNNFEFQLSK